LVNSGQLGRGPVACGSADIGVVTVRFRHPRGDSLAAQPIAAVRLDELSGAAPWRTLRWFKGQKHYSGWYWSATTRCSVIYESRLEQCRLVYADFDRSVRHIVAQPFMLGARVKGVARQHIPDYLLITDAGPVVVDVKPRERRNDTLVADALAWTRAAMETRGWSYEVWSEPPSVEANNLRFLSGFRRPQQFREDLVSELRNADFDDYSIGAAIDAVAGWPRPLVRATLFHLLWTQFFQVDLSRPLSASHVLALGVVR
jgi:hypothetical protein